MDVQNNDENTPLVRDGVSTPDVTVSFIDSIDCIPRCTAVLPWVVAPLIVAIIGSFCSLEMYRLTTIYNYTPCGAAYTISNSILIVYLSLVFIVTVSQLVYSVKYNNFLSDSKFRNYPILMIMIMCGCFDISYYTMQLLKYVTQQDLLLPMLSTVAEFLFGVVILPFVILCVCYKVTQAHRGMKIYIGITMGFCIGGCVMLFVKRVTIKIMRRFNVTCAKVTEEYRFVHDKIDNAAYNLILVDITYILIGLVFLVYLLVQLRHEDIESDEQICHEQTTRDFLTSITFVRYRWPTLIGSILLVMAFLCASYVISEIANSPLPPALGENSRILFLSISVMMYIACIAYVLVYHFTNNSRILSHNQQCTQIDKYFSIFTAIVQIMYGISIFAFYIWIYKDVIIPTEDRVWMSIFALFVVQVATQHWYINSVLKTTVPRRDVSYWNSVLFPPIALAIFNFGFLILNFVFLGSIRTFPALNSTQKLVYSIINDFLNPIAMLNRLHGLAFFINLSIQQWYDN